MISKPTLKDVDVLTHLFDAHRQFYGRAGDLEGARRYVQQRLTDGPTGFFVEREGDAVRGLVHLLPSFDTLAMRPMWILEDLFVDPDARGVVANAGGMVIEYAAPYTGPAPSAR